MVSTRNGIGIGAGLVLALVACDVVIGIPDRKLAEHLDCTDGTCVCTHGFGDCDGDPSNGCEADLRVAASCGACGHDCQNGACEAGACHCQAGFEDCDKSPKNGCEAKLADDAHNCGACGHDCLGGACAAGLCQPFTLQGLSYPQSLAISGGFLVLALCSSPEGSPLVELPVTGGGGPMDLATSTDCGVFETISGGIVYWSNGNGIFTNALAAPAMPGVFLATSTAQAVAATSTLLYWESFDSKMMAGSLSRMPLAGGPVEKLTNEKATSLVVDATSAYWGQAMGLYSVPHAGNMPVELMGVEQPGAIDVDANSIYAMENAMNGGIVSLPLAGGTPKTLAPNAATFALRVDGDDLYWLDFGDSNVYQLSLSAGTTRVLAEGLGGASNAALAFDATAVYWLSDQSVYKMAK